MKWRQSQKLSSMKAVDLPTSSSTNSTTGEAEAMLISPKSKSQSRSPSSVVMAPDAEVQRV
ncbi:unnamed protein product [Soboliphyme baturini]|uniref:Uncharacterized protein n=1 Tax=Soboliphyme baturini TaxID=241478 RepID=A0A183IVA1_9BILA|nr:unnamed protein product [Soboliphyme baturini]